MLELIVLQITAHHHLQHYEELAIADVSVAIYVVDLEGEPKLLLLVAFGAEGRESGDEFLEVHIPTAILVEDRDHAIGLSSAL